MLPPGMTAVPTRPRNLRALNPANLLTYARCAAVPVVVACFFWGWEFSAHNYSARWVALVIFVVAAATDYLDGWVARTFDQATTIGRMLDPIADKLLVAATLLVLAADGSIAGWSLWAAVIILLREILVSGLREYLATLRVPVPVTAVAKWKTVMQLTAIGFLIAGPAGDRLFPPGLPLATWIGHLLLWLAALLTLYTGWDYFRAGAEHLSDDRP
jgi:CDP-diacylglycerol--glycerol-3-phosphate 3-phosphatidyltransferase